MTGEDIEAAINKLRYQVKILGNAIDFRNYPIEALILEMDWNEDDIGRVHDIFEKWDRVVQGGGELKSSQFESDFSKIGINYQMLKGVINAFWNNGQWVDVCESYVDSFGASPSIEYHTIMKRRRD